MILIILCMLHISHISVSIGEKSIIPDFSYSFEKGNIYAILWKNGSGKSSLAFSLFRHPRYTLTGDVFYDKKDITHVWPDILTQLGLFLSFQNVPEIPGIRLSEYLRTIHTIHFQHRYPDTPVPTPFVFRRMVEKLLPEYGIDKKFLERDLNVGFSGGEKRRIELLQIALLDPECIVLDEIDSGLDIGAIEILSKQIAKWHELGKTCIVISHNFHLLDTVPVDQVLIMKDGKIEKSWGKELIQDIRMNGF